MDSHHCHQIKHLLGRTTSLGQKRRWEVLIGRLPFYLDDQRCVFATNEEYAAAKVGRALFDQGEPPFAHTPSGDPVYLICLVEAGEPLSYGSGCTFFAHHYAVPVDATQIVVTCSHPGVELLECGFAHLPETGGIRFLDHIEYMQQLEQFGLLAGLMRSAA